MNNSRYPAQLVIGLGAFFLCGRASAQCDQWTAGPQLEFPGIGGIVHAVTTWDPDGAGPLAPQVVIGGEFGSAGGTLVNGVARWDGSAWQPFGTGMAGHSTHGPTSVRSLAVLPSSFGAMAGQLVAAGDFQTAGGVTAQGLARWDGSAWQAIPGWSQFWSQSDVPYVNALSVAPTGAQFAGTLLIGGGGVGFSARLFIMTWNGTTLSQFGPGGDLYDATNNEVRAITFWDPDGSGPAQPQLVIGGYFGRFSTTRHNIVVLSSDGGNWQPFATGLGSGFGEEVSALTVLPAGYGAQAGQLVAGGFFTRAGATTRTGVARWDGSAWQPMGSGLDAEVLSFTDWDPDGGGAQPVQIVAAGNFASAGGAPISPGVARWDGLGWRSIGAGLGQCLCVTTYSPPTGTIQLVAGGSSLTAGSNHVGSLASFSSADPAWVPFTSPGSGQVFAMAQFGSRMVGAGSFTSPTGGTPHNIATWDGQYDESLGSGLNAPVHALKSYSTGVVGNTTFHLLAGGEFTNAGGSPANRIAIWSENSISAFPPPAWSALGNGFNDTVNSLERFNNLTIAGGQFIASGATTVSHIAQWNGTVWLPLGTGLDGACYALKVYNGLLYAGGSFAHAGGLLSGGLARWNGTSWSIVGGNFVGTVTALEVYNNELIIGGAFPGITGNPNIARYNSVSGIYSTLGSGGMDGNVYAMVSENANLYVGGVFTHAGGVPVAHLARWNGSAWSDVRVGTDGPVLALAGYHNEVQVGGSFSNVGVGVASPGWGRYLENGAPWIAAQPLDVLSGCAANVLFYATAADGYTIQTATWRRNGVPLADGPTGTGSIISGSSSFVLSVQNVSAADQANYDVLLTDGCGSVTSNVATLTIESGTGDGDGNGDGVVDGRDVADFVTMLTTGISQGRGICAYDMNGDGVVNTADLPLFVALLLGP